MEAYGVRPHLSHMEAVIGREGDAPARAVEGRVPGSLEDAVGQALDAECVDVLQPHQRPGCPVQVLGSRQLLLHLLEASMECCRVGKRYGGSKQNSEVQPPL